VQETIEEFEQASADGPMLDLLTAAYHISRRLCDEKRSLPAANISHIAGIGIWCVYI
jgi:hypothetical protein